MPDRHPAKKCFRHWPTRFLCVIVIALQAASLNWYLMENLAFTWAAIYVADAVVMAIFVLAIIKSTRSIHKEKHTQNVTADDLQHLPFTYIAWLVYAVLLDCKVVVIFETFSTKLDEETFFGPNSLKTTLALSGLVFISFLPTQHDVKSGTRKALIVSLTATVVFDIFDGIDILEHLFDKEVRDTFPKNLDHVIIATCCVNFVLPAVPLLILAKTKFALNPMQERHALIYKFALAYLVNFPLIVIRMVTWHGLSQGISIFLLKNFKILGAASFEIFEHFLCITKEEEEEVAHISDTKVNDSYMYKPDQKIVFNTAL